MGNWSRCFTGINFWVTCYPSTDIERGLPHFLHQGPPFSRHAHPSQIFPLLFRSTRSEKETRDIKVCRMKTCDPSPYKFSIYVSSPGIRHLPYSRGRNPRVTYSPDSMGRCKLQTTFCIPHSDSQPFSPPINKNKRTHSISNSGSLWQRFSMEELEITYL